MKGVEKEEECLNILCSCYATKQIHIILIMDKMIQNVENNIEYYRQETIEYQQSSLVSEKKKKKKTKSNHKTPQRTQFDQSI